MKVIDLFSGLGGFSEGFLQRGHDVTRYDNDERFEAVPETVVRDVFTMTTDNLRGADVVLASPPCQCFSTAAAGHYWDGRTPRLPQTWDAIRLVKHTQRLIYEVSPRYWVIENPVGRMRWILGPPAVLTYWAAWGLPYLKPTHLWGILPPVQWPTPRWWTPGAHGRHEGIQENDAAVVRRMRRFYPPERRLVSPVTANLRYDSPPAAYAYLAPRAVELRSLIPLEFSRALAIACETGLGQTAIHDHDAMSTCGRDRSR